MLQAPACLVVVVGEVAPWLLVEEGAAELALALQALLLLLLLLLLTNQV